MNFYITSIKDREKPKFDAYINGILFGKNGELGINYFISGNAASDKASINYKIKSKSKFSEKGMIRDKLVTLVHNSPILVVSEKFKDFLSESYPNHAEFYPVEYDNVNGKPLTGYYICNLIKKHDCADYRNSTLDFNFYNDDNNEGYGGIYTIDSLVIDEYKIPRDSHIFLLGNIRHPVIIISEQMKEKMKNENLTGFKFVKPENFMI